MQRKVAVILSGCGYKEGSEITEAVSVLVALSELGAATSIFAPSARLADSAKIAREQILPLPNLLAENFDAVILPGGFGVTKNLSSWEVDGAKCSVDADVRRVLEDFYRQAKPIAGVGRAPTLVARVLGRYGITLTVGRDADTIAEIEKCGVTHEECAVDDYITDREYRVVTTPGYLNADATPARVFAGIRGAVRELVEMA